MEYNSEVLLKQYSHFALFCQKHLQKRKRKSNSDFEVLVKFISFSSLSKFELWAACSCQCRGCSQKLGFNPSNCPSPSSPTMCHIGPKTKHGTVGDPLSGS